MALMERARIYMTEHFSESSRERLCSRKIYIYRKRQKKITTARFRSTVLGPLPQRRLRERVAMIPDAATVATFTSLEVNVQSVPDV